LEVNNFKLDPSAHELENEENERVSAALLIVLMKRFGIANFIQAVS